MDPYPTPHAQAPPDLGVSEHGAVATLPASRSALRSHAFSVGGASPVRFERAGEFAWMHGDVRPNEQEIHRALDVISAVPLAAAVGWSVRGNQWTTHPRRVRTAIVSPSEDWDIEVMRGVREVDCLSGTILVRMSAVRRVDRDLLASMEERREADGGATMRLTRAMRSAGFRLLYLGGD